MTPDQVTHTLADIGYQRVFTVIFNKVDGTQRKITGFMDVPTGPIKNPNVVPVKVTEGDAAGQWRSFRKDSVLSIAAD
tara:strand:- start:372 stop:605 length:234 start_codon:yes stop_codon:yes gene_type:complete